MRLGVLLVLVGCTSRTQPADDEETDTNGSSAASASASDGVDPTSASSSATPSTSDGDGPSSSGADPGSSSDAPSTVTSEDTLAPSSGDIPFELDECLGNVGECNDGEDNDVDGLTDLADPECLGPCDSLENVLGHQILGNPDCHVDCAYDDNLGSGDDECLHDLTCDPADPGGAFGCEYTDPTCSDQPTRGCTTTCLPHAPNGCDCFGCCEVPTRDGAVTVYAGRDSQCELEDLASCSTCTIDPTCFDPCDAECEVCVGATQPPIGCDAAACDGDEVPCAIAADGVHDCPAGSYCLTGCCHPDP